MGELKLNLGCGPNKKPGYINIDNSTRVKPDRVMDLAWGELDELDDTVDEVVAENLLDSMTHTQATALMREIHRVLKPGGVFKFHQGDASLNPSLCFGYPLLVSPYSRVFFEHFICGEPSHENWKEWWDLPGFSSAKIEANGNGVLIGEMVK